MVCCRIAFLETCLFSWLVFIQSSFNSSLLSSAYSTLSFSVLFVFCLNSFLFLSRFSISVSSILFLIVDFCVLFHMVSIDSPRIVFIFSIDGSLSFRVSNLGGFFF